MGYRNCATSAYSAVCLLMWKCLALFLAIVGCSDADLIDPDLDPDLDGYAADDCSPNNATIHPGAVEVCDGVDNDCDGRIDVDAVDAVEWFVDGDGDGYGEEAVVACAQPAGAVAVGGDCDDNDSRFHPDALESCDTPIDFNCDGSTGFADLDNDGIAACNDCDDADARRSPALIDGCDGIDNNCDSIVDNGVPDQGARVGNTLFPNLRDAFLAATEGSTIAICPGSYQGPLQVFEKGITIKSTSGRAEDVVITSPGNFAMFLTDAPNGSKTTIQDLTFRAANPAIRAIDMPLVVERCRFEGNTAQSGAAILAQAFTPGVVVKLRVLDSVFLDNDTGAGGGGAIAVTPFRNGSETIITGSRFVGNTAGSSLSQASAGAALSIVGGEGGIDIVRVADSLFDGNRVLTPSGGDGFGGAIFTKATGVMSIVDSTFTSNSAPEGGALVVFSHVNGAMPVEVLRSAFENNTATGRGGAILALSESLRLEDSSVSGNQGGTAAVDARGDFVTIDTVWGDNTPNDLFTVCGATKDVTTNFQCATP